MQLLVVFLLAWVTALATGLGALPVAWLGPQTAARLRPLMWGVAAGVMLAASAGLILDPLREDKVLPVLAGIGIGVLFLLGAERFLEGRDLHIAGHDGVHTRRSLLVFAVLFVHSLPEGFALGSSWSADAAGIGVFVFAAIALQNIPEGTATAIPMAQEGFTPAQQFWAAVGTSVPQPIGAVIAYLMVEEIAALLPWSLGFAAGAMTALVVIELLPDAFRDPATRGQGAAGLLGAMAVMGVLGVLLGA